MPDDDGLDPFRPSSPRRATISGTRTMIHHRSSPARLPFAVALMLSGPLCLGAASEAFACGDETGATCDTDEDDARTMLSAAVAAVEQDEPQALRWFTDQSHGFRTEDLYVYCIGPDHVMDAHPDPKINHTDVTQTLIDKNGFRFGDEMLKNAREGSISNITYLWPRLEAMRPSVKHTMYTKVKDQICAVGYYE